MLKVDHYHSEGIKQSRRHSGYLIEQNQKKKKNSNISSAQLLLFFICVGREQNWIESSFFCLVHVDDLRHHHHWVRKKNVNFTAIIINDYFLFVKMFIVFAGWITVNCYFCDMSKNHISQRLLIDFWRFFFRGNQNKNQIWMRINIKKERKLSFRTEDILLIDDLDLSTHTHTISKNKIQKKYCIVFFSG